MKKIAINGFGRIGRLAFRELYGKDGIEVVAVNDLTDAKTLAHLLKYDSAHGNFKKDTIVAKDNSIFVEGKELKVLSERDPKNLPWKEMEIDLVIESTGLFTSKEGSEQHIKAGAKKVVISAPAKGAGVPMIVYNVNHEKIKADDKIISAASCTTNCLAPVAKVLNDNFGIKAGFITTVHGYTNDQRMVDAPHRDLRRARAGAQNIIPTTTGAAAAVGKVLPELNGKLDGNAMRVPTITGSVVDMTFTLSKKNTTVEQINDAIKANVNETLAFTMDPIVSSDIIGSTHGSIFDGLSTQKLEGEDNLFKIVTWYDNEMSYVNQLIRVVTHFIYK